MNIKEIIPPLLVKWLSYKKQFESFESVFLAASKKGYQNELLCEVVAVKTLNYIKSLNDKPYSISGTNVFLLTAISNYLNDSQQKSITVLDFGGACGIHYYELSRFLTKEFKINWTVVETEAMVNAAKRFQLDNENVNFVHELGSVTSNIDFLYSSCTLLYLQEPYEALKAILEKRAKWVLFNRMMFNEVDRDIYTLQRSLLSENGPGRLPHGYKDQVVSYPHTTLSLNKFLEVMEAQYTLDWIFEEKSGSFAINNEKIIGKGMLFKRKT